MAKGSLPQNIEAEKAVLGAMLSSSQCLVDASGSLEETDFFDRNNRVVFKAIYNLTEKKVPVDIQTVTTELINIKEIDSIGGPEYLFDLTQSAITFSNLEFYIKAIKEQAVLRNLLLAFQDITKDYEEKEIDDISSFVTNAENRIKNIAESRRISDFISSKELASRVSEGLKAMKDSGDSKITGLTTGYAKLNEYTHGFQPGEMIIVAARPSVGKTALALNIAYNASYKTQRPVGVFSLEMPAEMLIKRLIANVSCTKLDNIQTGKFSNQEKQAVSEAIGDISDTKLFIDDTPGQTINDIATKARKLKSNYDDLAMIVIDYIGLITSNKKVESRQVEVGQYSKALKDLARELKLPVLVLCQLSRRVDERDTKMPILSDLRESGSIEQDADQVLLLYRPSYYKNMGLNIGTNQKKFSKDKFQKAQPGSIEDQEQKEDTPDLDASVPVNACQLQVIVAKNRNGKTGIVPLWFFTEYGRFDNPSEEYEKAFYRSLKASGPQE